MSKTCFFVPIDIGIPKEGCFLQTPVCEKKASFYSMTYFLRRQFFFWIHSAASASATAMPMRFSRTRAIHFLASSMLPAARASSAHAVKTMFSSFSLLMSLTMSFPFYHITPGFMYHLSPSYNLLYHIIRCYCNNNCESFMKFINIL